MWVGAGTWITYQHSTDNTGFAYLEMYHIPKQGFSTLNFLSWQHDCVAHSFIDKQKVSGDCLGGDNKHNYHTHCHHHHHHNREEWIDEFGRDIFVFTIFVIPAIVRFRKQKTKTYKLGFGEHNRRRSTIRTSRRVLIVLMKLIEECFVACGNDDEEEGRASLQYNYNEKGMIRNTHCRRRWWLLRYQISIHAADQQQNDGE